MTTLGPGTKLADRFEVRQAIPFAEAREAFLGVDEGTGHEVLLFAIDEDQAAPLRKGVGVTHAHLATVLGVIETDEGPVMVVDYVPGLTADAFADGQPRLSKVDVVRFALRLADALEALHHAGAVHGAVRPECVVIDCDVRARPVLTFAPQSIPLSAFRSPERGEAGPPSVADDAWALAAVVHRLLTGKDPPAVGVLDASELGLDDELLRAALGHALAAAPGSRSQDLGPLRRELARWYAQHAGDEKGDSSVAMRPPPLPPGASKPPSSTAVAAVAGPISTRSTSQAPVVSRSRPAVPLRARRSYPYILAGIAIVAGLGASWIVATIRARPKVQIVATAANEAPAAAGAPSAASVDLTEVAVTGEGDEKVGGGDKLTSCVAAHFPKDTFKKAPDLAWLCTEADPRVGGEKLRAAVVQGAAGGTTAAMKSMSQLGWYEMVELAVVRAGCCTEMKALTLPEPAAGCDALAQILTELGKAAAAGQSLEEPLGRYQKAAECEHKAKRASLFRRGGAPAATELAAFRELAKSVQAP